MNPLRKGREDSFYLNYLTKTILDTKVNYYTNI